ncbi:hypothetical protein AVEN_131999-1 [Araneus ventricosus]|uniref:Uncharacterized protein n=1 Tax=Araneus ventricosus TaxID=182803 RepID=A0A4Y2B2J4_ARAVE|nr:hypothetical protein AVEN_131999-1 [Araneus ventricosus]
MVSSFTYVLLKCEHGYNIQSVQQAVCIKEEYGTAIRSHFLKVVVAAEMNWRLPHYTGTMLNHGGFTPQRCIPEFYCYTTGHAQDSLHQWSDTNSKLSFSRGIQ